MNFPVFLYGRCFWWKPSVKLLLCQSSSRRRHKTDSKNNMNNNSSTASKLSTNRHPASKRGRQQHVSWARMELHLTATQNEKNIQKFESAQLLINSDRTWSPISILRVGGHMLIEWVSGVVDTDGLLTPCLKVEAAQTDVAHAHLKIYLDFEDVFLIGFNLCIASSISVPLLVIIGNKEIDR